MDYFSRHMNRLSAPPTLRWSARLLIALMALQAFGWTLAWQAARWDALLSARQMVAHSGTPLQVLTLSAADLAKSRVGKKEIVHAGRLYDIKTAEQVGDSVRLILYHDHHEQHLFGMLGKMLRSAPDASAPAGIPALWLAQCIGAAYLMPGTAEVFLHAPPHESPAFLLRPIARAQCQPDCDTPPPDCA